MAGGVILMWQRVLVEALPKMRELLPPESRILEVGYGDGLLTCYLCQELGWRVVGFEIDRKAQQLAKQHARQYGLSDRIEFRCGHPEEIIQHRGEYDGVFIKTVLYNSPNLDEYARWLDWIHTVIKPGGTFVNFKSGRANALTQWYRRLRHRSYTDRYLYTRQVEALYDARFEIIERRYIGGFSQFLAPVPALYRIASRLEENLRPRNADNSFIISIIARRPG
jgi:cyclopropane fatty-acyl-phospholipid synthase-like methyltransferase